MDIKIENNNLSIKFLESQKYKNMEIIPIKMTNKLNKNSYLNLKMGINVGLVEISECEISTVNKVLVRNKAIIPLILIDGDEIIGAKQNRIMNQSTIIPPKTNQPINVSCTEQGRWHYRTNTNHGNLDSNVELMFSISDYVADYNTRKIKSNNLFEEKNCQNDVWESINKLEKKTSFKSNTNALNDNYKYTMTKQDEFLKNFKIEYDQVGAVFIINGKIKGFELFVNPTMYFEYHEKILRSYIMEAITNYSSISEFDIKDIKSFLNEITKSNFKISKNKSSKHIKFSNNYGNGAILIDNEQIIHINYFANDNIQIKKNKRKFKQNFKNFREFTDNS